MPNESTENTPEAAKPSQKVKRIPGTTMLPMARVKRVIKEDKDIAIINTEATFCIAYATELFMDYFVNEAFNKSKKDKRKTIYYKDLANAVSEVEQFEFLEDVIPQPMPLKRAIELQREHAGDSAASHTAKRAKTNNKSKSASTSTNSIKNAFSANTKTSSKNEQEDGNSAMKAVVSDDGEELSDAEDLPEEEVEGSTTADINNDVLMGDA